MTVHVASLVPDARTRALARILVGEASRTTAVDAVLSHLDRIDDDQAHALIVVLLTAIKQHNKAGRPQIPLRLSERRRRELYTAYRNGDRSPEAVEGYREYQRANQRNRRARAPRKAA